eukprot:Phypoly_transcript_07268.p1 GENE.Phypoly_transcript_07268~~Phypoly_transcript_07268.p1  ORF type:complete len:356 (+),score=81.40 Phypoly_transcript_07268:350-1417(+)
MAQNSNQAERNQVVPRALVAQPPERLVCSICQELFHEPMIVSCFHSFCNKCLQNWKTKKTDCPLCRSNITSTQKHILLTELIEELEVHCKYGVKESSNNNVRFGVIGEHFSVVPNSCTVRATIKSIDAHEKECPFQVQHKYGAFLETIAVLKKNLNNLEESHKKVKIERDQLRDEREQYKKERNRSQDLSQKLHEENQKLKKDNKAYRDDCEELEHEVEELKKENQRLHEEYEQYDEDYDEEDEWDEEDEGNEEDEGECEGCEKVEKELEHFKKENDLLENEVDMLREDNERLKKENRDLQEDYEDLEETIEELEDKNNKKKAKIEDLEGKVHDFKRHGNHRHDRENGKRRRNRY